MVGQSTTKVEFIAAEESLVSQSTTEVEFIAAEESAKNLIWLYELLQEMKVKINLPIDMFVDNQSYPSRKSNGDSQPPEVYPTALLLLEGPC